MAQVISETNLKVRIEDFLQYLLREWQDLPWVASEWDSWEEHERLNFVLEWPIREDRLQQLRQWERAGMLNLEQRERYERLLDLVEQHRQTLADLLAD